MSRIELTPDQRAAYRAQAHHLEPVVSIGASGLTAAVKAEVDAALRAHGLIKVRVLSGDRAQRQAWLQVLADELGAAPVQHIGKLLVLWRPIPPKARAADDKRKPGPRVVKLVKHSRKGGQRPEIKTVKILGNQRLTPGGLIKKAKTRQKSLKKAASSAD